GRLSIPVLTSLPALSTLLPAPRSTLFPYTTLFRSDVLSRDEAITVEIDVAAMRAAWEAAGVSTAELSDAQVKKKTYRSQVFVARSEEHTSELQSRFDLVCRLLLEKKKKNHQTESRP